MWRFSTVQLVMLFYTNTRVRLLYSSLLCSWRRWVAAPYSLLFSISWVREAPGRRTGEQVDNEEKGNGSSNDKERT